jgi:hypothetical protein
VPTLKIEVDFLSFHLVQISPGQVRQQNVGSETVLLIGEQVMRATMPMLMHDNSTETLEMFSRARFAAGTFIGDCLHSHEAA